MLKRRMAHPQIEPVIERAPLEEMKLLYSPVKPTTKKGKSKGKGKGAASKKAGASPKKAKKGAASPARPGRTRNERNDGRPARSVRPTAKVWCVSLYRFSEHFNGELPRVSVEI